MNFPVQDFVKAAACDAINEDKTNQYAPPKGHLPLRRALGDIYSPFFGRQLDVENEILVTAGANEGIYALFAAFLEPGSEVILMEPYFDQYLSNVTMNGGVPVYVPLRPGKAINGIIDSGEWKLDMNELKAKITPKTKIIILNTPHNPIGKVFNAQELEEIGQIALENDLIILSDEVYDCLVYHPESHLRIGANSKFWDRTITLGSAGKTFGVTGWRVGWLIGPESLIKPTLAAQTRIVFCTTSPLQQAVANALEQTKTNGFFEEQLKLYTEKRDKFAKLFRDMNIPFTHPAGSYFLLVDTSSIKIPENFEFPENFASRGNCFKMCYWLCAEIGVTSIPASEFYSDENAHLADSIVRFAFCKTDDVLDAAAERLIRLKDFIK